VLLHEVRREGARDCREKIHGPEGNPEEVKTLNRNAQGNLL